MSYQRIHPSRTQNPQTSSNPSQFTPRPISIQHPNHPPTPEELENQAFQQDKFEATKLQLKQTYGTTTPVDQERLGTLQAKMDSFWSQRIERANAQPNLLEILNRNTQSTQTAKPAAPIQPKLTIGTPNNRYKQETDRVAGQVMPMTTPVIQRQPAPAGQQPSTASTTTPSLPSANELTTRIARCIGIWETNRGQDNPAPQESSLDTVAGVHASMATIEQATMPYAINALKQHKSLRDKATPPLTMAELNSAEKICIAVETLLKSITQASKKGEMPDDFINNKANLITPTGLSNDDVKTMFSAVALRTTLDTALTDANAAGKAAKKEAQKAKKNSKRQAAAQKAAKQKAVQDAIDAIPVAERLGLGPGSLRTYINKPKTWGENRAGWQRKAVSLMLNNIGSRIESVAVSDSGTALAIPIVGGRVNAELAKTPVPSLENIVKTVAQKNNPNEANYGKHVWETYHRLYP
jgi:cell fate (sporulation/competence/biofilm development) regulator YmcA (YheA/YmcA/DUF963 family)